MNPVLIHPHLIRQYGATEGSTFCLVTNSEIIDQFQIEENGAYRSYMTLRFDQGDSFNALLENVIPEPAHILVISPQCFFESPLPEKIGPRRKLIAMPCNSTPTSLDAIAHFLGVAERTDPQRQQAFAERFFELGQSSEYLEFVDENYETHAIFDHLSDAYEWNLQAGFVDWAEQQIAPSGEISVLPVNIMEFNPDLRLALNGEIALKGQPAVHSGTVSFLPEDQARVYDSLATMRDHAVIATVRNGFISELKPTHYSAEPAAKMLGAMIEVDSRYGIVWEIGFGINTNLPLLTGNFGMNEPYGGSNGVFHLGLGLTPFTQYALIIICPGTRVLGRNGEVLIGSVETQSKKRGAMNLNKSSGCPCQY